MSPTAFLEHLHPVENPTHFPLSDDTAASENAVLPTTLFSMLEIDVDCLVPTTKTSVTPSH